MKKAEEYYNVIALEIQHGTTEIEAKEILIKVIKQIQLDSIDECLKIINEDYPGKYYANQNIENLKLEL